MPEPETNPPSNPVQPNADSASPGADTGGSATDAGTDVAAQLALAKAEAAANFDKFVRTAADLENFRRRTVREKDDLRTIATGRVLEDVFPVLDTLALAINA